jgi:hypothetical protein
MCTYLVPFIKKAYHPETEELKYTIDRLFEIADYNIFDFSGGEIFVRRDLADILYYAYQYNEQVIDYWCIVTNCCFPLSAEIIEIIKLYGKKLKIKLDNYGELSPYFQANYNALIDIGAWIEVHTYTGDTQYFGGWVSKELTYEAKRTPYEAEIIYSKCLGGGGVRQKLVVLDGKVCYCTTEAILKYVYDLDFEDSSFPLIGSDLSIEEVRKRCEDILNGNITHPACRFHEPIYAGAVEHRIPAAEQLTADEIKFIRSKTLTNTEIFTMSNKITKEFSK